MANHKKRKPKTARAGCLLCHPNKLNENKTAERMREKRKAFKYELLAESNRF